MKVLSPNKGNRADSVSVCGKMLRDGQTIIVPASAIGPREEKMMARGKIRILPAPGGQKQIRCTLG